MNLLFVCTHNACRSILAEAIARRLADDRLTVASAGSEPAGRVHPLTLEFLARRGFDVGGLRSSGFDDLGAFEPDVVITVCDSAAESCPVFPGNVVRAHWGLPDPSRIEGTAADREAAFGRVADILEARIGAVLEYPLEEMTPSGIGELLVRIAEVR